MQARVRIETAKDAAAVQEELQALEDRFRSALEPSLSRLLAREIIRLRMSLTSYALRCQIREVHDQHAG